MLIVSLKVIWQNVSVLRNSSVAFKFNWSWILTSWDESLMMKSERQTNSDYAELRLGLDLGYAKSNALWARTGCWCCVAVVLKIWRLNTSLKWTFKTLKTVKTLLHNNNLIIIKVEISKCGAEINKWWRSEGELKWSRSWKTNGKLIWKWT